MTTEKRIPAIVLFKEERAGTTYIGFRVGFRDANDPSKHASAWLTREEDALCNIEYAGFVSDIGEAEFIGWQDASFTKYHPGWKDMECAIKLMKRFSAKADAFKREYGALTLGKLAVVIAKCIKAKHIVQYNRGRNAWDVYALSADLIDHVVSQQEEYERRKKIVA